MNGNFSSLKNDSIDEMRKKAKKWHDSLGGGTAKINYVETHPILLDFRDKNGLGFYWANLETNDSREECERMGHCGRTANKNIIYSCFVFITKFYYLIVFYVILFYLFF